MSYATNVALDSVTTDYLVVMKPRKRITEWTHHSGTVYRAPFPYGYITRVERNGVAYAEKTTTSLSTSDFYFDYENQMVYIRKASDTAPDSDDWIIATFELHLSTSDFVWNRDPLSSSTALVQYNGLIRTPPTVRKSTSSVIFGFYPIQSTSLTVFNDASVFQEIIYDASFNNIEVIVYHVAGNLEAGNITKVMTARAASEYSGDNETITFSLVDKIFAIDKKITNPSGTDYYATASQDALDPLFDNAPIRMVLGMVWGFIPVNISYNSNSPTTSDNRSWAVTTGQSNMGEVAAEVTSVSSISDVFVSVADAKRLFPGDDIWIDKASGTDQYGINISSINYGTGQITFSPSPAIPGAEVGDLIRKSSYRNLCLVQGNEKFDLLYGRDYTEINQDQDSRGFDLTSSAESNVGASTFNPLTDYIICDVVGRSEIPTVDGSPLYSGDQGFACVVNGIAVLYDFLKNIVGLEESEIDTDAFEDLVTEVTDKVGIAIPERATEEFPTYMDVLVKLLQTLMLKAWFNEDGKFTIARIGPNDSAADTVLEEDTLDGSFGFSFNYDDLSSLNIKCAYREVYLQSPKRAVLAGEENLDFKKIEGYHAFKTTNTAYEAYEYLHKGTSNRDLETYHFNYDDFFAFVERIEKVFGERSGKLTLKTKNKLFPRDLGEVLTVSRKKLPGFAYDPATSRTRSANILEIEKSNGEVMVVLDDQKGIEDNTGDW